MLNLNTARDEANRLARAREIVPELRTGGAYGWHTQGDTDTHFVTKRDFENSRNDVTYTVNLTAQTCTCPDFTQRRAACKHLYAVELALQEIADEEMCARYEDAEPFFDIAHCQ